MNVDTFSAWDKALGLRRTVVLFVTLWMTWRTFTWAAGFVSGFASSSDPAATAAAAALLAAVMAPVTYLQKAVFAAYLDSKEQQ